MSKPRHRDRGEHGDSHERWLITYADMITLLMAFFIMMYAMSVVDLKKFAHLSQAMGHVFGGGLEPGAGEVSAAESGLMDAGRGLLRGEMGFAGEEGMELAAMIQKHMQCSLPEELYETMELSRSRERITVSLQASAITFPIGEATLTAQARQILTQLGAVLSRTDLPILVEGHTCDLPISTPQFPSNWELSAARANAVMVFLMRQCRIAPERITTAAYAATRPRVPNSSEANRRRNRRVDIVLLPAASGRTTEPPASEEPLPVRGEDAPARLFEPIQLMPPMSLAAEYHAKAAADGGQTEDQH